MSTSEIPPETGPVLDVIPLGGLGEFGMNMLLVAWEETAILIDAGAMFPGPELPGVDLVIPHLEGLAERVGRLTAVVLTHGHEDHIGALAYVWPLLDGPVYGTPLTLALVGPKLDRPVVGHIVTGHSGDDIICFQDAVGR
jgi:ribonuclease J